MENSTVTISLEEYNNLRDMADFNKLLMDKILFFESRMNRLEIKMGELECRIR